MPFEFAEVDVPAAYGNDPRRYPTLWARFRELAGPAGVAGVPTLEEFARRGYDNAWLVPWNWFLAGIQHQRGAA